MGCEKKKKKTRVEKKSSYLLVSNPKHEEPAVPVVLTAWSVPNG